MLTEKQLEEKAKLENLKMRLEYLDSDLKLGNITKKQYSKEKELIDKEVMELEESKKSEPKKAFDTMMGNPMEMIDNLIEEGKRLVK